MRDEIVPEETLKSIWYEWCDEHRLGRDMAKPRRVLRCQSPSDPNLKVGVAF